MKQRTLTSDELKTLGAFLKGTPPASLTIPENHQPHLIDSQVAPFIAWLKRNLRLLLHEIPQPHEPKQSLETVERLYEALQATPDSNLGRSKPTLAFGFSTDQAFSVIWFLQECLRIIPDQYEQCNTCQALFDANAEGGFVSSEDTSDLSRHGAYCDWHDDNSLDTDPVESYDKDDERE